MEKVVRSHIARDMWLCSVWSRLTKLADSASDPPIIKVSIFAIPRNPTSMPEFHDKSIYVVSTRELGGLMDGFRISDLDDTID